MNKKFDIISMILIIALTIILIAFVFNYFTKSNETTPTTTDIPFENIHVDVPTVSGSNPFVSSTPVDSEKIVEDKHIINETSSGDSEKIENQESGENSKGIIDNIKDNESEPSSPAKDTNPLIITSNDNVSDKEKKEVLKELDETLMDLLDVIETVKTVDESRLPTDGSEVQP